MFYSTKLTSLVLTLVLLIVGCGRSRSFQDIVTFGHDLPRDANVLVAKSGPFSPDMKYFLVFEASRPSVESFALSYTGSHLETLATAMGDEFYVGFGAEGIPEWDVDSIKNGRYYRNRTKHGTGYLLIDTDRNRVYLQR